MLQAFQHLRQLLRREIRRMDDLMDLRIFGFLVLILQFTDLLIHSGALFAELFQLLCDHFQSL